MASGIPDSDSESDTLYPNDVVHEPRDDCSLTDTPASALAPQISPLRVDFDDFLDPTQALSDQSPCRDGLSRLGAGSMGMSLKSVPLSRTGIDVDMRHPVVEALSLPAHQLPGNDTDNDRARANQVPRDEISPQLFMPVHQQAELDGAGTLLSNTNTTSASGYPSTTVSSYGGYQSIELNFRDGLYQDINPFGEPTQVSLDGAGGGDVLDPVQQGTLPPDTSDMPVRVEAFSSPPPVAASLERPHQPQSKRRKTDDYSRAITTSPAPPFHRPTSASVEPVATTSDHPQPKKRGRKPKSRLADSAAPDDMAPPDPPTSTRARPVTLDSSQLSHEETPSNTKRKRMSSKADTKAEEASVSKYTSSELQADEEELIGLPKENYKPRPSRRRSKPFVVEEPVDPDSPAPLLESVDVGVQNPDVEAVTEDKHTPEPKPPVAKASKRTKKSKVKRAKTSAAALLKKSCPMISDGEDDVIWLDEKPTTVKLDLPPDLKKLKKEVDIESEAGANPVHVDIAAVTTSELAKSQPDLPAARPDLGPTTHSPIAPASAWNSKSRFRVGLSKRQSIPSLLRKVDKTKAAPTKVGVQNGGGPGLILRDKDGNLVEWEF
ncbi:hypothetical protein DV738_g794, partial [Chaetothyriales sp. CBS 135597]